MSYSQFETAAPKYRDANLMIDVLELFAILRAEDGAAFDEHWQDMLATAVDSTEGHEARLFSKLEERRGRLAYEVSNPTVFPYTYALMASVAGLAKAEFVTLLMGPSSFHLPETHYPGWQGPERVDEQTRMTFAENHCVSIENLWDPKLLNEIADTAVGAPFAALDHENLGVDYSLRFAPLQAMLHVLTSDRRLRALLADLCGLKRRELSRFSGRVYRMIPGRDADVWHNDVHITDRRLIALSLALEGKPPRGGDVVLRRAGFLRPFHRESAAPRGTLTLFRIAGDLEHKVTRVYAGARTNFAGWYLSRPAYPYWTDWLDRPWFGRPSRSEPLLRRMLARR
ncbi:MAG: hypothetical protein AAF654_00745 [Myxococcota bacterium]